MNEALERLEKFIGGHKARSVTMFIDDGYGARCWMIELFHENGRTCGQEVSFFDPPEEHVAYASTEDWTDLETVINVTLDAFEAGMITPQDKPRCPRCRRPACEREQSKDGS